MYWSVAEVSRSEGKVEIFIATINNKPTVIAFWKIYVEVWYLYEYLDVEKDPAKGFKLNFVRYLVKNV